mmetsp:Transcript_21201/g.38705  ORF Transcript_21201/g.38705 Transcript_21201/m.38705 type:complete len:215 (+) Transcript_21201:114-758(+)
MHQTNENIRPKVLNLLLRQIAGLGEEKLDGIHILQNAEDPLDIQAVIEGPTQTPYEGGAYRVKICIGADFPQQPPRAFFLTKIFHPNIAASGDVCVNTLKRDWDPSNWSIGHILQVIRCLLIVPFPESALNEEAGRLFMECYAEYAAHAAMINRVHARPQPAGGVTAGLGENVAGGDAAPGQDGEPPSAGAETETARRKQQVQAQRAKKSLKRL